MTFRTILEYWPWSVGYVSAASAIFLMLRWTSSTDERAASTISRPRGADASSLVQAALEFFRFACPLLLLGIIVVGWSTRAVIGQWNWIDLLVVAGVVAFWPIQEWLIHVFLLHLKPFEFLGRHWDPIVSRNHRNHHRDPWTPELGITPPHMIWLYCAGLPALWALAMPIPQAVTGVACYFTLALNYEWLHFLIHTAYVPKTAIYRRLWRNHRLHHFKNEHFWYGVTMLSGDRILRTQPAANNVPRSETCLTLGVESQLADWTDASAAQNPLVSPT